MEQEGSTKKNLQVSYSESKYYQIMPANGAVGGPTPRGEIMCSFYFESVVLPNSAELLVEGSGPVKEIPAKSSEYNFVRELQAGIVLSPEAAKSVGEFLIRNAEIVQKKREAEIKED